MVLGKQKLLGLMYKCFIIENENILQGENFIISVFMQYNYVCYVWLGYMMVYSL